MTRFAPGSARIRARPPSTERFELVELLIDRVVVTDDAVEMRCVVPNAEGSLQTRFCRLRHEDLDHPQRTLTRLQSH
jgi:site-specific DNA recombinase